ncbi:MAG: hypothetical protein A2201_01270 [Alicyclobacillus sp. RIFOXYA1_FULL_53_8]|nr:MAG: hypothetical protein A2201_01270 [Alicyclobacillus sp. RIFOXYA1_FULL_53_8]
MRVGLRKATWAKRRRPGWVILAFLFLCTVALVSAGGAACNKWKHAANSVQPANQHATTPPSLLPRLQLTPTGVNWFERPVYKVTNLGTQALSTVVVYNWSGLMLTPLYIGLRAPTNLATRPPLDHSPITLPSGTSLWVVGSSPPPVQLTVMWQGSKGAAYDVLRWQAR